MRQRLVGFDTRVAIEQAAVDWQDAERRRRYLLRDVRRPLSIDEAVWLRRDTSCVPGLGIRIETPRSWRLADALAEATDQETVVAFSVLVGPREPEFMPWLTPPELSSIDARWEFLGWDIAENAFPSALTNCGYEPDEREALSARFGAALNDHHLFGELAPALACRRAQEARILEHGPWAVLGLYRVR